MKLAQIFETDNKQKARWVRASGPNSVRGFEFQHERDTGWSTVGFAKAKPESTVGSIEVYDGASGKDVTINLRNYTFGDEDAIK